MDLNILLKDGCISKVEDSENNTMPSKFKVEHKPKICEDCCKVVTDRRVLSSKSKMPFAHWRSRCTGCELWKNPVTGIFDLNVRDLKMYYQRLDNKLKYLKKKNKAEKRIAKKAKKPKPITATITKVIKKPEPINTTITKITNKIQSPNTSIKDYPDYYIVTHNPK